MESIGAFPEAINYQYLPIENEKNKTRIFMNYVNSFHGKPLAKVNFIIKKNRHSINF